MSTTAAKNAMPWLSLLPTERLSDAVSPDETVVTAFADTARNYGSAPARHFFDGQSEAPGIVGWPVKRL
jgi:hypothetical protein